MLFTYEEYILQRNKYFLKESRIYLNVEEDLKLFYLLSFLIVLLKKK